MPDICVGVAAGQWRYMPRLNLWQIVTCGDYQLRIIFYLRPEPNGESCMGSLIACTSANLRPRHFLLSARLFAENAAPGFSLIHSISVI
jgi:hypothetical protein